MKLAVDLHIHSALSPCSSNDMTPGNIVNMAKIKGLDVIAITDHNSAENCIPAERLAAAAGILLIPGMEIETKEEVHLVCLFPGMREANEMQNIVYGSLPYIKNREDVFGRQLVMDEHDNIINIKEGLLLTAASICAEEVLAVVARLEGIVIPAHVDRNSYSILSSFGAIPDEFNIRRLELSRDCDAETFMKENGLDGRYNFIKSSDAHYLGDIFERQSFINVEERNIQSVLKAVRGEI